MTTTLVSRYALQAATMLTSTRVPTFCMKDFQDLDKMRLLFAKPAGFTAKAARFSFRLEPVWVQRKIPELQQLPDRKHILHNRLWLIPHTLAKKLLTTGTTVRDRDAAAAACLPHNSGRNKHA